MRKPITRFEDIEVWQLARKLCLRIWEEATTGTFASDYKLRAQNTDSSGSIMDNVAEGYERNGNKEFIQFLYIAKGSAGEVKSQLYRAYDRKHIKRDSFEELFKETSTISGKIMNLIKSIKDSDFDGPKFKDR